jgi:hypothetical protein
MTEIVSQVTKINISAAIGYPHDFDMLKAVSVPTPGQKDTG